MRKKIRQRRVRAKIKGTSLRPRLSVYRSHYSIYAQLIDDEKKTTLFGISDKDLAKRDGKISKTDMARELGLLLAKKARDKKIKSVVFDRGSYLYHGRVKAVAEGAREGGLKF